MKRLSLLVGILSVCLGCAREPSISQTDAPSSRDQAGQTSPAEAAADPTFLQRPLGYWIDQAKAADRTEDVDTTVEALTLALRSDELAVMVAAADALEVIGPEAAPAASVLTGKLDHVQPWVRCAAMDALTSIGAPAVPALVETFQKGPGNAPIRAAIVLGSIGPPAKDAVAVLEAAMPEASEGLRARLEGILAQIDPGRAAAVGNPSQTPRRQIALAAAADAAIAPLGQPGEWPQFHGPRRDSICRETGLLDQWPEGGPTLLWKLEGLGNGYSTISIAGGRLFTMGDRTPDGQDASQFVIALDPATRQELWATRVGGPHDDGPRCTPTVDGELLYALGTEGTLVCLEAATGDVRWQKSLPDDFGGKMMSGWKYSESPLIDARRLICTPGGDAAAIVALDKKTGATLWKTALPALGGQTKEGAGYSSVVAAEIQGIRQYVQLLGRGLVGVDAETGQFLWGYGRVANTTANITMPVVRGNYVFATTSYNTGCALLEIVRRGPAFQAKEVYFLPSRQFDNHHGGIVLLGDHVYGGSGQNRGAPVCLELATGKIVWKQKPLARGSASVLYADGRLLFRYDRGLLALVEATPEAFRVQGTFEPPVGTGPAWAHPVIHGEKLYLRHNDLLLCYELAGRREGP
ncbi:MAG: PQQ-binding-like beta-propeller repeat protein [Pirellulales bacterium]|nr:PQQ-binding-like beta-propeller repeat protein [Pirellulales bacterium]